MQVDIPYMIYMDAMGMLSSHYATKTGVVWVDRSTNNIPRTGEETLSGACLHHREERSLPCNDASWQSCMT